MKILNTNVPKGKKTIINLNIAKLHTGTSLSVPIIIQRGKKDGPCILFSAGIHGDEINGVEIVRQIISNKFNIPECGTVICIPVINVFGFLNQEREFPDGRDLNRMFPGSKRGSLASRFAYYLIKEIVPHIDYCIDFHTGGDMRFNYSQIRVDASCVETLELAQIFGVKFIKDAETRDKSFRKTLADMGKKVLLFEGGKTLNLDRLVTVNGINGALRVMSYLGIRDFSNELKERSASRTELQTLIKSSKWIRAKHSGMFRSHIRIGTFVKKDEIIGSITDPYGNFESNIKSGFNGYIICANHAALVNQGDALFHISKDIIEADEKISHRLH
ncbi:MAG: succinylglutamate desuccinylase/aspartoacylase family protein [Saprospiraceae bacterium]|nr:succinylglutamate desuccinylase/aspartoacylase family protein [Saprospiraceae bacterium]